MDDYYLHTQYVALIFGKDNLIRQVRVKKVAIVTFYLGHKVENSKW